MRLATSPLSLPSREEPRPAETKLQTRSLIQIWTEQYHAKNCCNSALTFTYWDRPKTGYTKLKFLNVLLRYLQVNDDKGKGKVRPRTDNEGPEREQMYSSTVSSTSALDGGWVVSTTPRPLYHRERPGITCIGGWVGPRGGLDGCGKSRRPTRIRSPDRPARSESLYRLSYRGPIKYLGRLAVN